MQETWDLGSVPVLGRFSGAGNGNPLQYSCLENPMDRGAWWATVHGLAKSWTQLKWLSTSTLNTPFCSFLFFFTLLFFLWIILYQYIKNLFILYLLYSILFKKFFFFFLLGYTACGILVSQPVIEPMTPSLKGRHPSHWTTREVPVVSWMCIL